MKEVNRYGITGFFIVIIISFIFLPMALTQGFIFAENIPKVEIEVNDNYDFSKYKQIKLLHKETGEIEEIELENYIVNVLAAEMPVDYELEALKAQAVVARTYTLYQILNSNKHENADMCDDSKCCQAWISKDKRFEKWETNQEEKWNKLNKAVYETQGEIITYQGNPIDAFFHSNSGGMTEIPINVWGGSDYPYLQAVETSGEDEYNQYYSENILSKQEFEEKMKQFFSDFEINWADENCIEILEYTESNRIRTIKIGNKKISGVEARKIFELKSSNFSFEINENNIKFIVIGYGHGVGMSQTGSNTLAKENKNYKEIINHFYKDIEIKNIINQ